MCFKNLLSKALWAFAGVALIVAGCDKAQTPPTNDDDQPKETVKHFTVTLDDITTVSCLVSIDKDDDDQFFYYAIVRKKSFEELGSSFQERAKAYYEGEIEFYVNDLGYAREDAIAEVTSNVDLVEFPISWLSGNTDYVLIVGYINPNGNPAGDFECVEFNTEAPEASDNKLEVKVSEITARTAHITVTTTNSDQYKWYVFPASQFGELSGAELAAEMLYYYSSDFQSWEGDTDEIIEALKANTDYVLAAVGCTDNASTTEIATVGFKTQPAGDVHKWNYTVNFTDGTFKGYNVNFEIIPNDDTIDYCYEFIPVEYTQEEFTKQFYENLEIMEQIGLDKESYIRLFGTYGSYVEADCSVKPGHSYKVAAIPVDPETGDFLEVIFSKAIEVEVPEDSDITIEVSWDKYFNGEELPDLWLGNDAIFNPVITTEAEKYFFGVYQDDGTTYEKGDIIVALMDSGTNQDSWSKTLTAPFDKDAVLYAIAVDENGLFGPVFTKKFKLSKEGASPADEYEDPSASAAQSAAVKKAAAVKAGSGKTDEKKAAAEKIRKNWFSGNPRTFVAK